MQAAGGVRALALCIDAQDAAVALAAMNAVARVAVDVPIKHNLGLLGCVPLLVSGSGLFPIIRTPFFDSSYPYSDSLYPYRRSPFVTIPTVTGAADGV